MRFRFRFWFRSGKQASDEASVQRGSWGASFRTLTPRGVHVLSAVSVRFAKNVCSSSNYSKNYVAQIKNQRMDGRLVDGAPAPVLTLRRLEAKYEK
ncbi:hypothetical protein YC2023_007143 [Brassica napus]